MSRLLWTSTLSFVLSVIASAQTAPVQQASRLPELPRTFGQLSYPPIARLARIEGAVSLTLAIAPNGSVSEAVAVAGPELLRQSSVTNARGWTFEAGEARTTLATYLYELDGFCDSSPTPTITSIRMPYSVVRVISCHSWAQ